MTTIALHTTLLLLAFITGWQQENLPDPTIEAVQEWQEMADRHEWFFAELNPSAPNLSKSTTNVKSPVHWDGTVEQWRPLVTQYFQPADVEWALAIISCESSGSPNAVGPTNDHGLFQHLGQYWTDRSTRAGWAGAGIYDPEANIAVAAWLLSTGGKGHWVCRA